MPLYGLLLKMRYTKSKLYTIIDYSNELTNVMQMKLAKLSASATQQQGHNQTVYYIPITDTTLELSIFWPSDTESQINELRFSESISLSFKTRLTSVTCFCGDVT